MSKDVRADQAKREHRQSRARDAEARQHREARDYLVRVLRREDPSYWTYTRLAAAIGCSPELIAHIIRTQN